MSASADASASGIASASAHTSTNEKDSLELLAQPSADFHLPHTDISSSSSSSSFTTAATGTNIGTVTVAGNAAQVSSLVPTASSASSAATAAPETLLPHMSTWLSHDEHTPSLVLPFLRFSEIARLHTTCTLWKQYISNPKHSKLNSFTDDIRFRSLSKLKQAAASTWLPRIANSVEIDVDTQNCTVKPVQIDRAVVLLSKAFIHVKRLVLRLHVHLLSENFFKIIGEHFPLLKTLALNVTSFDDPNLPHLTLEETMRFYFMQWFAPLKKCKQLSTFVFTTRIFTEEQILDLLSFESLTSLNYDADSDFQRGAFHVSHALNCIVRSPMLPRLQLRRMNLDDVSMTPEIWDNLCQLPTLTSLVPPNWPTTFGEQWSKLSSFPNLLELKYQLDKEDIIAPCKHFWKALLQVHTITRLDLFRVLLTTAELNELFHHLPELTKFSLTASRFESCAAFSESSKVEYLTFEDCFALDGSEYLYHECLPTIHSLRGLKVAVYRHARNFYIWKYGGTVDLIASWKKSLMQRMPLLTGREINYVRAYDIWRQ